MPHEPGFGWNYPAGTDTAHFDTGDEEESVGDCTVCSNTLYILRIDGRDVLTCDRCGGVLDAAKYLLKQAREKALEAAAIVRPTVETPEAAKRAELQAKAIKAFSTASDHATDLRVDLRDEFCDVYADACEALAALAVPWLAREIVARDKREAEARAKVARERSALRRLAEEQSTTDTHTHGGE